MISAISFENYARYSYHTKQKWGYYKLRRRFINTAVSDLKQATCTNFSLLPPNHSLVPANHSLPPANDSLAPANENTSGIAKEKARFITAQNLFSSQTFPDKIVRNEAITTQKQQSPSPIHRLDPD